MYVAAVECVYNCVYKFQNLSRHKLSGFIYDTMWIYHYYFALQKKNRNHIVNVVKYIILMTNINFELQFEASSHLIVCI